MQAVVVYESMYGNTHAIADHIAVGLSGGGYDVAVVPVGEATAEQLEHADLVVCGGPTHVHTLSSEYSRRAAATAANKDASGLSLEPAAYGPGLRDWFKSLDVPRGTRAAAFDTRMDALVFLTGRASKGIGRRLRSAGFELVVPPESFLIDKQNRLVEGEAERAAAWGAAVAAEATAVAALH